VTPGTRLCRNPDISPRARLLDQVRGIRRVWSSPISSGEITLDLREKLLVTTESGLPSEQTEEERLERLPSFSCVVRQTVADLIWHVANCYSRHACIMHAVRIQTQMMQASPRWSLYWHGCQGAQNPRLI
jgi:hypothetical protein